MLPPLTFRPLFKQRLWGGRSLATLFGKPLPPGKPIGESWEITDRPEGVGEITNGPWAGRTLRQLMETQASELLGEASLVHGRFPLLCKLLDARDVLSLQVHPPADRAFVLEGEPKTELWYIAHAEPGAALLAGFSRPLTRDQFAEHLRRGTAAEVIHRLPVRPGDALFLPSGRVHALGAGIVLFEIQQNSDTTYRVFDWNRADADGHPRELHVEKALASIDFNDVQPGLVHTAWQPLVSSGAADGSRRVLAEHPAFHVEEWRPGDRAIDLSGTHRPLVLAVVSGTVRLDHPATRTRLAIAPGGFCLVPAVGRDCFLTGPGAVCLIAEPGILGEPDVRPASVGNAQRPA